ncbi:NAD-dependent epimerase/dehydratase family protein [Pseudomonas vlassakiae]|uniref:NAD-dependent epimerase/dehydratase family protein n=1 Tax=Pseudomonas vlassakiae TaxID=485888 RepID=A0A923K4Z7_9PSED|nr:NAD-dependent epimerase/dehydratase family protein [Pseudomonas vlassakiae]MBV4539624.1 NAD-dependent epimerase/dehydratase family protein [Pseudomonas vlassakiae]
MTENILITGGAGFIGSRLIAALLKKNPSCKIWVFDNLHPQVHGVNPATPDLGTGVTFVKGDVTDAQALTECVKASNPNIVYHLAAETGTGQSYDEPTRYCAVNVIGTTNLIEALRTQHNVSKVVLAGSRAVYGEGGYVDANGLEFVGLPRQPEAMEAGDFAVPVPANAVAPARPIASHAGLPPAPASVYASTKLMQEYLLCQAGEGAPWDAVILRFQNVYGPGQSLRNPYTGVLSIFARQILSGAELAIYEDGEIARDFAYVDDIVSALVLAGDADIKHGTILDIGSGEPVSILEISKMLMRALGKNDDAFKVTGAFRIGDIRYACADITAAKQAMNWIPRISVQEGVIRLAEWAKIEYSNVQD